MASLDDLGIPFRSTPQQEEPGSLDDVDRSDSCSYSSGDVPVSDGSSNTNRRTGSGNPSIEETASTASSSNGVPKATKRTRTRTVKSRAIFTPEDDSEKKPRGRGGGRRRKRIHHNRDLQHLLKDEVDDQATEASAAQGGEGQRKRSRNASHGENRWDRVREKVKLLLQKMRRDAHFLEVYQHDGWKSSGREKLKPTAELQKVKERMRGVKVELREVAKRLTEMNASGPRWRGLKQDKEGLINVAGVVCSKCGLGDSDDNDDILLCDYAGCFRAYHQNCLTPAIKRGAFPSEEEDWFCWQCECLTDCLDMIEQEFQGSKFRSWEDVFPNLEAEGDAGDGQENMLLTDSEDSDDESFKGSSSESEDEGDAGSRRRVSGGSSGANDGSSDEEESEDEEMGWMSDAESVGADEVAKLHSEAGDWIGHSTEDDGEDGAGESPAARGDRGSRARTRQSRRASASGEGGGDASDQRLERPALVASLAGDGTLDTANILDGRRRRKAVDYVKLNQDLFGDDYCEDLDGDKASSEAESESSEASACSHKITKRRRQSTPSIDPFTGEKRKPGRPRKFPNVSQQGAKQVTGKRKRGRPRKIASVPRNVAQDAVYAGVEPQKRKPGRPRKVPVVMSTGSGQGETYAALASATAARVSATGAQSAAVAGMASPSVPQPVQPSAYASSSTDVTPPTRETAGPGHGLESNPSYSLGSTTAAAHRMAVPSVASPLVVKRGRGRPRKNPPASSQSGPGGPATAAATATASSSSRAVEHANGEAQRMSVATADEESSGRSNPLGGQGVGQKMPIKRGRGRPSRKSYLLPPSPALNGGAP